jgi:hypothetical protein
MAYKILKILDKYRVVANIPSSSGVKRGDSFIVFSKGEEIKDESTDKVLERIDNVKARLKVIHVQKKISILESSEVEEYVEENPLLTYRNLLGPKVRKVMKPLNVDIDEKKSKNGNKTIRVGDSVKKDLSE